MTTPSCGVMSNVAEFESNCLRYFSIQNLRKYLHDTSNAYFIPHLTVFSYYRNNTDRVFSLKTHHVHVQCYFEKQIHPAI